MEKWWRRLDYHHHQCLTHIRYMKKKRYNVSPIFSTAVQDIWADKITSHWLFLLSKIVICNFSYWGSFSCFCNFFFLFLFLFKEIFVGDVLLVVKEIKSNGLILYGFCLSSSLVAFYMYLVLVLAITTHSTDL